MIVPAMSNSEVMDEMFRDFPKVENKARHHSREIWKKVRKAKLKQHKQVFDYVSPNGNKWFYIMYFRNKKDVQTGNLVFMYVCHYVSSRGFRAVLPCMGDYEPYIFYNGHMFDRYKERYGCNATSRLEIAKDYFKNYEGSILHTLEGVDDVAELELEDIKGDNNKYYFYKAGERGVELGYTDMNEACQVVNTFITNDMLKGKQLGVKELYNDAKQRGSRTHKNTEPLEWHKNKKAYETLVEKGIKLMDDVEKMDDYDGGDKEKYISKIIGGKRARTLCKDGGFLMKIFHE